jgi:acetoin utilization deacetylase AcuC-like enzyme
MPINLIYDSAYLKHDTGVHPENARRLEAILHTLDQDDSLSKKLVRTVPRPAHNEDIVRCHREDLIYEIESLCKRDEAFIDADTRISPESFEVARLAAGAALTAVDTAMREEGGHAFALIRPPGHHATISTAMGFCLFNNAAIGARYAQVKYDVERVLIIDWDVHHGNGTQEIFWEDPSVFYFSTHQYPYYPGTGSSGERGGGKGEGYTLNIPLPMGTSARHHRQAFTDALHEIERKFPPDLIIISAGFDSRRGDPLGGLMLEDSDFYEMTKDVLRLADKHAASRVVGLLEGGYNLDLLGNSVKSHISALL